jgi:hypothetical protein
MAQVSIFLAIQKGLLGHERRARWTERMFHQGFRRLF